MLGKINQVQLVEMKKTTLSYLPFLILMDTVLLFTFQELDSILTSSCGFVLATWQLRNSANMHILGLCEGYFPPPFVSIVYLYGAEEHFGKKARCEPASLWQLVSRLLRRKASKVMHKMSERNFLEQKMGENNTMEISWALITRNGHLFVARTFLNAAKAVF